MSALIAALGTPLELVVIVLVGYLDSKSTPLRGTVYGVALLVLSLVIVGSLPGLQTRKQIHFQQHRVGIVCVIILAYALAIFD